MLELSPYSVIPARYWPASSSTPSRSVYLVREVLHRGKQEPLRKACTSAKDAEGQRLAATIVPGAMHTIGLP